MVLTVSPTFSIFCFDDVFFINDINAIFVHNAAFRQFVELMKKEKSKKPGENLHRVSTTVNVLDV